MERAVGWFVLLAAALLAFGFAYYVYTTAARKGWFKTKAPFFTFTDRATGLKVGDPVHLMGFAVGQITQIEAQPPYDQYEVYVEFEIQSPYYDYLWTEGSRAKVATADLLGKRVLEVTKGTDGYPAYTFFPVREVTLAEARALPDLPRWLLGQQILAPGSTNILAKALKGLTNLAAITAAGYTSNLVVLDSRDKRKSMTGIWKEDQARYEPYSSTNKPYWLESDESPAVTERLEKLVGDVESALPNILGLTNQLARVLSNTANLTSNLNLAALSARPVLSNLAGATANLDRPGALGEWLLPTNVNRQLEGTLGEAQTAIAAANTNLAALFEKLDRSLDNLADLTSNLNKQVQENTNVLSQISSAVVDTDNLVQGLKHHWLLRSAFKTKKTNAPPAAVSKPLGSSKKKSER